MKVLLCTIVKNEENYLDEFINYYKELGFANIVLYDNSDTKQVFYNNDFVKVDYSFVNKKKCQLDCYSKCYCDYKNDYDWIAFFDVDEFLMLNNKYANINDYLSDHIFDNYDTIKLNWKCYGDNDIEKCTSYQLKNRFVNPLPIDIKLPRIEWGQNNHIKSIVRCKPSINLIWLHTHCPSNILNSCDCEGNRINKNIPFNNINYKNAWINHYITKTINEYIQKIDRGYADIYLDINFKIKLLEEFFIYNKETPYKRKQIENYIYKLKNNNLTIYVCAHKKFDESVVPKINHKILYRDDCNNFIKDNFDNCFSEGMQIYELYKNIDLPNYVGICHYRRYFDIEDYSKLIDDFKNYDIIVTPYFSFNNETVYEQYSHCFRSDELRICGAIIKKYYPEYLQDFCDVMNNNKMYLCNMMIIDKDRFKSYCSWIFDIMFKYLNHMGFKNDEDIIKWCEDNKNQLFNINKDDTVDDYFKTTKYCARICGHLMERLMNVWIKHNIQPNRIKEYNIKNI